MIERESSDTGQDSSSRASVRSTRTPRGSWKRATRGPAACSATYPTNGSARSSGPGGRTARSPDSGPRVGPHPHHEGERAADGVTMQNRITKRSELSGSEKGRNLSKVEGIGDRKDQGCLLLPRIRIPSWLNVTAPRHPCAQKKTPQERRCLRELLRRRWLQIQQEPRGKVTQKGSRSSPATHPAPSLMPKTPAHVPSDAARTIASPRC